MKEYLTLETHRNGYDINQCGRTLTVKDLVEYLEQWPDSTPVYFSNDNGYTYGSIDFDDINSNEIEEDD